MTQKTGNSIWLKTRLFCGAVLAAAVLSACASTETQEQAAPRRVVVVSADTEAHGPLAPPADLSPSPGTFRNLSEIEPDQIISLGAETQDWYKDSVFYHIWINAFNDSTGDGIGDIPGITARLDYLADLGVTGIWLSPFFSSSSEEINLHMYDTVDHYTVDPRFGSNDDLEELLVEAHARNMRVIFDWVPNHVSDQHPWFIDSAAGENDRDDWFVWRDRPGSQEGPWGQGVWHRHSNGRFFYGVFWRGMPDINFRSQAAKDAITNVAVYWLNKGFDGIRVDAVKYLYEDEKSEAGGYDDQNETFEYFQAFRSQILDTYSQHTDNNGNAFHKFMVAENWTHDRNNLERYMYENGKTGFHMTLDFPFAGAVRGRIPFQLENHWNWVSESLNPEGWMGTFLSNHDNVVPRPFSVHGANLVRAAVAAQLLGPGTPFLYYGNEIGMPDSSQFGGAPHEDRRHRQAFDWTAAEEQLQQETSLLSFHRDLIELRNDRASLRRGDTQVLATSDQGIVFVRSYNNERSLIAINMNQQRIDLNLEIPASNADLLFHFGENSLEASGGRLRGSLDSAGTAVWELY